MNRIQAGRLLTLAHFLRTQVPRNRFNMDEYVELSMDEYVELSVSEERWEGRYRGLEDDISCGSAACALGWASVVWPKKFRLMESGAESEFEFGDSIGVIFQVRERDGWGCCSFKDYAIKEFFGLALDECYALFSYHNTVTTPKGKGRQIERLVSKHGYVVDDAA